MVKADALPFDVEFIDDENVPEPPRKNDRDDERWQFVKDLLNGNPGKFLKAKVFDSSVAAGQKASNINGGNNKMFPAEQFEARYTRDKEKNTSTLFLLRKA